TEYHIYRGEGPKGVPVRIGTVSAGTNSFQDLGAVKDTAYVYTVRAYNGVIESADSNQAGPITSQDNIPPAPPRGVAAADQDPNNGAALVVSWAKSVDDVPGGDVVEYRVYRSVVPGGYSSPVGRVAAGQTGYTDTTAEGDGEYYFVVRAFDGSNESEDSNEVGPIVPVDSIPPEPPTSVAAVDVANDNGGSVRVSWKLSKDDAAGAGDVLRYEVRRYTDPAGQAVAAVGRVSKGETSFVDLGLVDGTPYYYAVFASDGVNAAGSEIIGPVTSTDDIAPAAPAGLAAEAVTGGQGTQIRLEWGRSPDDGGGTNDVRQYDIFRARSATDFGSVLASAPAGTTTYVDEDALPNIAYYYIVKAADARNRSLPTAVAGPIQATDITPPATPTGLASAAENGRVTLSWTASKSPDVTGYFIYRSAAAGTSYRRLNGAPQRETRYVDESVTNGVTYTYRVSAVDSSVPFNESALTDAVSAVPRDRTPPDTPTGLAAQGANRQVTLKWAANTDQDLAGYNVYRSSTPDGSYARMNSEVVTGTAYTDVQVVNGTVYYYRITAVDTAVPANESEPTDPVVAQPVRVFTLSLPAGAHMLGIPSTNVAGDPRATLHVSHDQWRLARWWKPDAADASYHFADPTTLDADASFTPPDALSSSPTVSMPPAGIGYWIVLGAPGEVTLSGGTTPGGGYYVVRLYRGWNLVGNPWEGAMNWGAITTSPSGSIQPVGWQWDLDQGYVPLYDVQAANVRSQVAPLTSFWVYATSNCNLVLPGAVPVAARATSAASRSAAHSLFQGVSWKISLSARAGQRRDDANWIGVSDGSASPTSRILGPPPGAGYVDLYVTGSSGERLAADFRQSGAGTLSWDLRVESDIPNVPVDVLVPDLRELPRDWALVLTDLDSGEEVFLRTTSTYRIQAGPGGCRRSLRLVATRDRAGGLRIFGFQSAAVRRGGVSLTFQMTRGAATTVQVLNAAGRVVRTVESDQPRSAGAHELYWDGLADSRSRVPSGMYTIRIGARAADGECTQAVQVVRLGF
ncbi:MAG TPA: FlgD immunoglobulin-like domain containing protein, partial [Armatimonadota bacterium]|nr:FlgD immunoglobulin-like domain containing protein [Armatimonadota bacterium]